METITALVLAAAIHFTPAGPAPEAQNCGRACSCDKVTCTSSDGTQTERPGCSVTCPEAECAVCTCEATCDNTVATNTCDCR